MSGAAAWRAAAGALGCALLIGVAPASAHAPPLGARVLSAPDGAELIVTNRGLVFREADTGEARLLCNEALRVSTAELPNAVLLGDGALLIAASSGLRLSRDGGCSWSGAGSMETSNTPALASDPSDPDRVYVALYGGDAPGLRMTRDGGATWSTVLSIPAEDYINSLLVAGADPARIYATVATFSPGQRPTHAVLRTRDGGAIWERIPLPLLDSDYLAVAAATDPSDPETLLVYTISSSPGQDEARLLLSRDGGDHFEVALARPEIRGAGMGGDGRSWVAARDGLYGFDVSLGRFQRLSDATELGCVSERDGALVVCGHYAGVTAPSGVGVSADGGRSFEHYLDFSEVTAPVTCPADSQTTVLCRGPWLDWQAEMLTGVTPPASAAPPERRPAPDPQTTGADASGSAAEAPAGAACTLGRGAHQKVSLGVGAALALWWCRRRQRRARIAADTI